jgi:autotransporter family porin
MAAAAAGCTLDTRVASVSGDGGAAGAGGDGGVGVRFGTLRAGATLPDDATCARLVRRKAEQRPENATANARVTTPAEVAKLGPWNLANMIFDEKALAFQDRISGAFAGTTDELIQWTACKWGFDEDHIRAEAFQQSGWIQAAKSDWTTSTADCAPNADTRTQNGTTECAQTYGMLQVVWKFHKSAWPMFRDSTPFHLDFVYAMRRVCFEGWDVGQSERVASADRPYEKDDEWGCMGGHFSGQWYDDDAEAYIARVQGQLAGRAWEKLGM